MISKISQEQVKFHRSGNLEALEALGARTGLQRADDDCDFPLSEILVKFLPVHLTKLAPVTVEERAWESLVCDRLAELHEQRLPLADAECDSLLWTWQLEAWACAARRENRRRVPDVIAIARLIGLDEGQVLVLEDKLAFRSRREGVYRMRGRQAQQAHHASYERWRTSGKMKFLTFCKKLDGDNELIAGVIETIEARHNRPSRAQARAQAAAALPSGSRRAPLPAASTSRPPGIPGASMMRAMEATVVAPTLTHAQPQPGAEWLERARNAGAVIEQEKGWKPDTSRHPYEFLVPRGRRPLEKPARKTRRRDKAQPLYAIRRDEFQEVALDTLLESEDAESHS